jgi:glycosyltransferase involved in cell wall biosynthesis
MRRIVHYYPAAMGHSGVSFALWSWARAQAAAGFDVCIMHAPSNFTGARVAFVPRVGCEGVSTVPIPHRGYHRMTLCPSSLDRHLGPNDLLILHEGWVMSNLVAARAAERSKVPYVVMPHGVYEPAWTKYLKPPRWLRNHLERQLLEGASAVHVFFESEIADIRRLAPRASFVAIPTGFDLPDEHWTGGGGYLAWLGRIDPIHKGLDLLIGAIAQLSPGDRPTVRIRGYDYNGGVAALQRLVAERNVARWVRLEGPAAGAEKARFLQQADGYIHPSRWECHSIALLENLALGAPCLVSNAVHIADTLRRCGAAILSSPTERSLAMTLPRLPEASADIARRGRNLISETFNWNVLIPQFKSSLSLLGLQ